MVKQTVLQISVKVCSDFYWILRVLQGMNNIYYIEYYYGSYFVSIIRIYDNMITLYDIHNPSLRVN